MSDISLDEFTQNATTFLDANAERRGEAKFVWGQGSDRVGMLDEKTPEQEARGRRGEGLEAEGVRRRLRLDHGSDRVRRRRPAGCLRPRVPRNRRSVRDPVADPVRHRPRHGGADDPRPPSPRCGAVPPSVVARRDHRLPALLRAGRRLRPRRHPDQGRARWRRVDPHRPEGVDVGRAVLRHRRDHHPHVAGQAEAQGPDDVRRRHARARGSRSARCAR